MTSAVASIITGLRAVRKGIHALSSTIIIRSAYLVEVRQHPHHLHHHYHLHHRHQAQTPAGQTHLQVKLGM